MLWTFALVSCLTSEALAYSQYHQYENMAAFNFPVNASTIQPYLHPSTKLDLDKNGVAWVSIFSGQLVSVPVLKPLEMQVRTYVTGPDPVSKQPVKGCWIFDVVMDDWLAVVGARALVSPMRVVKGSMEIVTPPSKYTLKASELPIASKATASVYASATIKDTPIEFEADFFLNRTAWFGQTKAGELAVSMLHGSKYPSLCFMGVCAPRQMEVSEFSSGVLPALSLGHDVGVEVCKQHKEGCFYIGNYDVTFDSAVVVSPTPKKTVTVYHLFQREYTGLANKDAGDFTGDASFIFETFYPFETSNPEASLETNIIEMSTVTVEDWGTEYLECNAPGAVYISKAKKLDCPKTNTDYCCVGNKTGPLTSETLPAYETGQITGGGYWYSFPKASEGTKWTQQLERRISGSCVGNAWRKAAGGCSECGPHLDQCIAKCIQAAMVRHPKMLRSVWDMAFSDKTLCPDQPLPGDATAIMV